MKESYVKCSHNQHNSYHQPIIIISSMGHSLTIFLLNKEKRKKKEKNSHSHDKNIKQKEEKKI